MSNTNETTGSTPATDAETIAAANGYSSEPAPKPASQERKVDTDLKRRNLAATFGSGPGKLALIATAVIVVVFGSLAIGQFRQGPQASSKSQIDSPTPPSSRVTTNPVTPEEAARRAEQARMEALQAQNKGASYQPGFDYNIASNKREIPTHSAQFAGLQPRDEETPPPRLSTAM